MALDRPEQLQPAARSAIEDPANVVFVSAVSPWEIAVKAAKGRLTLPRDLPARLHETGFEPLAITWEHGLAAGALPLHHRDPFDRMLVAQARAEDLTIVTRDAKIAAYDVRTMPA